MQVERPLIVIVSMALIVLSIPALAADLTVTVETNGVRREMFLTQDKLCFRDAEGIMVFDAGEQRLKWVDLEDKSVREITQQELKQISATAGAAGSDHADAMTQYEDAMVQARKQAADALANSDMTDDDRKMAQHYMDKAFGGSAAADSSGKRRYLPTGKSHEFNGRKCTGYAIEEGGVTVGELCTASLGELDLARGDLAVIGKLRDFFAEGMQGMPFVEEILAEFGAFDPSSDDFLGFPVHQVETEHGERQVTNLVSLDKGPVDPQVFEAGEGMTRKPLLGGP
jgi:hypothetical protein